MKQQNTNDDYVPFGDEWRREMMRWRKADLVEFLRRQSILALKLERAIGRGAARWRGVECPLPEPGDHVLLLIEREADGLMYVSGGFCPAAPRLKDGRRWTLTDGRPAGGRVIGWMPMEDAVNALGIAIIGWGEQ